MKKIIALLLVAVMAVSVFAACGSKTETNNGGNDAAAPADSLEVLSTIWGKYSDEEKFPIIGSTGENMTMDIPGKVDNLEDLQYTVYVPAEEVINVADAAFMQHAMNANTFSCGAMKLAEGVDAQTFATTMKDAVLNTQWMCGFPEKLVVAQIADEYILVAFGLNDAMTPFQTKLAEAYADANVLFVEDIL